VNLLIGVPLYLAPFLVGLGRWRRDRHSAASPQFLLSINVLLGWTGIGWLVAWWLAFRRTGPVTQLPVHGPWVGQTPSKPIWGPGSPSGATADPEPTWNRPNAIPWREPEQVKPPCPDCHGTGLMKCKPCDGRGTWWQPATTASGSATLVGCIPCNRSGKVQCTGRGPHG